MKYLIFLFLIFGYVNSFGQECDSLFKVTKISLKGNYYNIEATKNDSVFLIISKKVDNFNGDTLAKIKKGKSYSFDFAIADNTCNSDSIQPLKGIMNHLDIHFVYIDKEIKIKTSKRHHYRVYSTKNLIDLYYVPPRNK